MGREGLWGRACGAGTFFPPTLPFPFPPLPVCLSVCLSVPLNPLPPTLFPAAPLPSGHEPALRNRTWQLTLAPCSSSISTALLFPALDARWSAVVPAWAAYGPLSTKMPPCVCSYSEGGERV